MLCLMVLEETQDGSLEQMESEGSIEKRRSKGSAQEGNGPYDHYTIYWALIFAGRKRKEGRKGRRRADSKDGATARKSDVSQQEQQPDVRHCSYLRRSFWGGF